MGRLGSLLLIVILSSCSTTRLTKSWKNPEHYTFRPKNVLVIGVTPDFESRSVFEFQLKNELNARKINALQSVVVFEKSFQDAQQTEAEIENQVDILLSKGYDSILVSLVKGVDDNQSYSSESPKTDYHLRRFIPYYCIRRPILIKIFIKNIEYFI